METHEPAAAAIREEGERILQVHCGGDHVGALQRAQDLAGAHEDSPTAVILHAYLLREAACRVTLSDFKDRFNKEAEVAYRKAALMLPNCIDSRVSLGEILFDLQNYDIAEAELTCALEINHPTDPLVNNLAYDVSRPLRSSARTRIKDVRKRGWNAREENRARLVPNINSMIERVLAVRASNVALKRAEGTASTYSFSIRAHLLHAHMSMEFAYSLPDRVRKSALQRVLPILDNAKKEHKCDFQKSLVVSIFRAKMLCLLQDYAAAEHECRRGLRIQDADDPAQQDVPPGSIRGCDKHERTYSCRAQLSWLLVKLVSESITFYLSSHDQHEKFLSFTFSSLMQQSCASDSAGANMLLSAGKQFDRHNTWLSWICPCCKIKNLETPGALLKHIMRKPLDDLPQSDILQTAVETFEGKASDEEEWPSDELMCDRDTMRFSFQDINSIVKLVTEAPPGSSFADILEKKRYEAAAIYEKIRQELQALPTERSSIQVKKAYSEVTQFLENLRQICKVDLLLPLARLTLWRNILKQMSIEVQNSSREITAADMEILFNRHREIPIADVEEKPKISAFTNDDNELKQDQRAMKISDPSLKKQQLNINVKGRLGKAPILDKDKMLESLQNYLNESSGDDHIVLMILQFLFRTRIFQDKTLRESFGTEQESQLRDTIYKFCCEWRKHEYTRMSELVSSFKEVLVQACNDRATFPQVRQAYASEAVAVILKRLHISIPSTLGIKMLLKTKCGCGGSVDTERIMFMLKFDTACTQNKQVTSFSDLELLYDEPHQCLDCGIRSSIDISTTHMPPTLQIVLYWSTGSTSPSTLNELMVKLNSPQEISFFCQGIQSSMKYKLTSMICWSKGLYVFFGREKKRWIIFDNNTTKTLSWTEVIEWYRSGNLQLDILCFESAQGAPRPWNGPPDIFRPREGTGTSQRILPTLQQSFRSSGGKSKLRIEEDGDEEEQLHLSFKAQMESCPSDSVFCLICHLMGSPADSMKIETLIGHCKRYHTRAGIKCSKQGCPVRALNRGEIGKHQMYCHRM